MFGKSLEICKLSGIPIRVDASWVFIAALVTWSLAGGVFPAGYPGLSPATYWVMGVAGAGGLFLSIILHELSHAWAARRKGIPMKGVTLFIFGGVAEMEREPPSGEAEFVMAIAGPLASVLIALLCGGASWMGRTLGLPDSVNGVFAYLGWINGVLVAFNLIPAFPLDGGRVLRAALWRFKGSLRWATRVSSEIGSGFGLALTLIGVFFFIGGAFIAGIWWVLIGMFLRGAAQMSYRQVLVRRWLEGEKVSDLMRKSPVTVRPDVTIQQLVDDFIYEHHFKMFPVTDDGRLRGCVTTRRVRDVPRREWPDKLVDDVVEPCSPENSISKDVDALQALSRMNHGGNSRLLVVEGDRLVGVIALKDVLRHLSLKMELEEDGALLSKDLNTLSRLDGD